MTQPASSMSLEEQLNTDHQVAWGECEELSPMVRRITAKNPSNFTFKGTGTYIVGRGQVAVIDPGPADDNHIEAILRAVRGEEVTHVLITHTHRDHSPATGAIVSATGAATFGFGPHPPEPDDYPYDFNLGEFETDPEDDAKKEDETDETDDSGGDSNAEAHLEKSGDTEFSPQEILRHLDVVEGSDWTMQCLHTPGHISNHLCFALSQEQTLFTGDHIMGWSSTIIPPPSGDLGAYLDSLRLLIERGDAIYLPTHGPAITNRARPSSSPQSFAQALLDHRQHRTRQILHYLGSRPQSIASLVSQMYSDKPKALHKPASQSVLAHLILLLETGQVKVFDPDDADSDDPETAAHRFALA